MRRFFCIFFPPLAVLSCGKPISAIGNCLLCLMGVFPGIIHAWSIVSDFQARQFNNRSVQAINDLRAPLYAQAEFTALAALQPRRRTRRIREDVETNYINDPYIGTEGRTFRRRS
jgi:uncharacterized membrane protein YqaE (UPF0057 family)